MVEAHSNCDCGVEDYFFFLAAMEMCWDEGVLPSWPALFLDLPLLSEQGRSFGASGHGLFEHN